MRATSLAISRHLCSMSTPWQYLGIWFLLGRLTYQTCYNPDGTTVDSRWFECQAADNCCVIGDVCLAAGYCFDTHFAAVYHGGCQNSDFSGCDLGLFSGRKCVQGLFDINIFSPSFALESVPAYLGYCGDYVYCAGGNSIFPNCCDSTLTFASLPSLVPPLETVTATTTDGQIAITTVISTSVSTSEVYIIRGSTCPRHKTVTATPSQPAVGSSIVSLRARNKWRNAYGLSS